MRHYTYRLQSSASAHWFQARRVLPLFLSVSGIHRQSSCVAGVVCRGWSFSLCLSPLSSRLTSPAFSQRRLAATSKTLQAHIRTVVASAWNQSSCWARMTECIPVMQAYPCSSIRHRNLGVGLNLKVSCSSREERLLISDSNFEWCLGIQWMHGKY